MLWHLDVSTYVGMTHVVALRTIHNEIDICLKYLTCERIWMNAEPIVGLQGAAAAMFPFEDENNDLHWDEYGAALQPDEFQHKSTSRPGQLSCLQAAYLVSLAASALVCFTLSCSSFVSVGLSLPQPLPSRGCVGKTYLYKAIAVAS